MKRGLILAISALALTATSRQLIAAESETAAPLERAAPARERLAPVRQLQRAPVQRQAAQTSQSSSFTGSQAGGFGGGNAGGGGFADPAFCGDTLIFGPQRVTLFDPRCGNTTQPISRSPVAFSGGAEYGYMFPLGPYAAAGFAVDVTGSGMKTSGTQTTRKVTAPLGFPLSTVTETLSTEQSQPLTTTLRLKAGFVPWANTLIFVTAGGAVGKVSGSFSYSGIGCCSSYSPVGAASYNLTRVGYTVGGGVSWAYPVFGIAGTSLTLEYLYTNLGTVTRTIPLVAACVGSDPLCNIGYAQTSMKTENSTLRLKVGFAL